VSPPPGGVTRTRCSPQTPRTGAADALTAYAWLWEDEGLNIPVNPDEYYAVAVEANGNLTLARRDDGRLLRFAPDHDFSRVAPLAGCPPYSLLTIADLSDLPTWIEAGAAAWQQPQSGHPADRGSATGSHST
jgi:hypothetical protein